MTRQTDSIIIDTRFGPLAIDADDRRLLAVRFNPTGDEQQRAAASPSPLLEEATRQFSEYFAGSRKRFDLPCRLAGTEFQEKVWQALAAIDFGSQRTYAEIASQLGNGNLARAVGQAAGRNPLLIIIPCHRLVGSGGALGGFAAGIDLKKRLLAHEQGSSRF